MSAAVTVGSTAKSSMLVDENVVRAFSRVSRDKNPVHLDQAYAARSRFGRRVAHGMLSAALLSSVIGNELPGPGTIYLSQTLNFRAPVYLGNMITATVKVVAALADSRYRLATCVVRDDGRVVLDGEALVLYEGNAPGPATRL